MSYICKRFSVSRADCRRCVHKPQDKIINKSQKVKTMKDKHELLEIRSIIEIKIDNILKQKTDSGNAFEPNDNNHGIMCRLYGQLDLINYIMNYSPVLKFDQ